jgi:hypothetical protein
VRREGVKREGGEREGGGEKLAPCLNCCQSKLESKFDGSDTFVREY